MTKIWHIIKYEYTHHVFRKRFLFSLLSLPLAVVAMIFVAILIGAFSVDTSPVGYIDHAGIIQEPISAEDGGGIFNPVIPFQAYQEEEQAIKDLEDKVIQAYFVIPEAYPGSIEIELIYFEEPSNEVQNQFTDLVRQNLLASEDLDPDVKQRLEEGNLITMTSLDSSHEMREDQWYMIFTPFIAGITFMIVVMTSGGYLLQAVVEEKENRTMEIMITSVTPNQLMTGKIIGNIAVGLTQLVIWLIFGWIGLKIGGQFWPILQDFSMPTNYIFLLLVVMLPSFVMVSAIMAAIGSTMTDVREAQQVSGLFSLPMMIPYYISSTIMMNPNGALAVILSYFPLTSPITILMRLAFTIVPAWELAINIMILIAFAIFAIWFAGRAFRLGMLRYGKKLSIKEIFGKRIEK
jgi:ABC-2 type transport system permease protein